ncbi:hydrolase [Sphingomonas oligoaromativorans]|uniref:hydrolase n=1 Tax=Sphingomonas oligoaromativorans TaxID=575322 RepID=UPI00141FC7FF|nr:hydrolase [Sphingomonas oligoaromativorans]NIJ33582.1 nicotinamidase-related amidase [Sphingomonas oligoaromativorans]
MSRLDPRTTALVLIDLQQGIVPMNLAPRSGADVVATSITLADRFRAAGAPVVLVHVGWAPDFADRPSQKVDQPMAAPEGGLPENWSAFVDGVRRDGDLVVMKRHWGAFTGTELDLQLRRRSIQTIVLGGIATNFGVESTARSAWELGYDLVIVEDACASSSAELHAMSIEKILPRIARVTTAGAIGLD